MANISVNVKETGIDQTQRKLKRLGDEGKKTESTFKDFGKNASAAIAAVDGPLGGIASRVTSITTLFTAGTAAVTTFAIGISGITAALVSGTRTLDEYNVNLARTEALLNATGQAVGFTAEQLNEQAAALALNTLTSTQEVQKAQAQLLTFNRVAGEVFENAIVLSQDLAESGFGSITSNAVQLGKALQDPIRGISALTRVGVSFNDTQRETIRLAQEAGDIFAAQQVIIEALQGQVGGAGASVAQDSLAGKADTLGQKWDELAVTIAESAGTLTLVGGLLDGISETLQGITDSISGGSLEQRLDVATQGVEAFARAEDIARQRVEAANEQLRLSQGNYIRRAQASRELQAAELELQKAVDARAQAEGRLDDVAAELADRDEARAQAAEQSAQRQAQLAAEEQAARDAQAEERAQKEAEQQAARLALQEQRQQESIDKQTEAIRRGLLTEQELRLEDTLNQAEIIAQSTLAAEEQTDLLSKIWAQYYSDLAAESQAAAAAQAQAAADAASAQERQNRRAARAWDNLTSDLKDSLGEQNALFKATASVNALIKTYEAANSAYAALAPIPFVGPALGAAAAGAAIGAGLANVRAINSARQQGGTFNRGDNVLVGERGPEVVSFGQSGRVTPNNQLGMNTTPQTINNVYNYSSASVQVEENETGGVDVYVRKDELDELVGSSLSNPNSESRQALDSSYSNLQR